MRISDWSSDVCSSDLFNWKQEQPGCYEDRVKRFFAHDRFLRMLKDWILFFVEDDELRKTILRQHQTRAAIKVAERCAEPGKRRGLCWHTQGWGQTFTMCTAARLIRANAERVPGSTGVMV